MERRLERIMRSQWVDDDTMSHILAALTTPNRNAVLVSMITGLRISDVLSLKTPCLWQERFTVTEQKTNKRRTVRLPLRLRETLLRYAGRVYVFEGRLSPFSHRTRQAVYKDIRRAAEAFRITCCVSPHSARKCYAVREYKRDMDIRRVQRLLNHDNEAVTMLYAMADQLTEKRTRKRGGYF